jgi:type I restriction enzyme R subunit
MDKEDLINSAPRKVHSFPVDTVAWAEEASVMNSQNFEFLRPHYPELADLAGFAEIYAVSDQESSLVKLRTFNEFLVKAVFAHHQLPIEFRSNLNDLLNDDSFKEITPPVVLDKIHLIRIKGNHAAHGTLHELSQADLLNILKDAHGLAKWLLLSTGLTTAEQLPTWADLKPAGASKGELKREKKAALQKLEAQESLMKKLLADLEEARAKAEAVESTKEQKDLVLKQAQQAASALDFSEAETRRELIDAQLVAAGWQVSPDGKSNDQVGQEVPVLYQPTESGKGAIDYVLYGENGKALAIVEAKKTAEDSAKGKMQAKYYADGIEKESGHRPVIFYTNGFEIFIWNDAKKEPPRALFGFYSRDSLEYDLFQREQRDEKLAELYPIERITDRFYQVETIKRVAERFDSRRRKALIVQATGTGKTRVALSLAELMIRAKWAKRILFLCDRRELRKQAGEAFTEHLPNEPSVFISGKTSSDRKKRIYLATYNAMINCYTNFDVGFFDLIIADESHRSIYNRYRDIFRYFDSFQVGLTATPLKFIFRDTYKLFECETEDPTANYTYEEAINHEPPFLCPFKVIKHTTKFLREGIKYKNLTAEQKEQLEDDVDDPDQIDFEAKQVGRKVFSKDTDRAILHNLMENGIRNADGSHVGKTIIFARNHKHAKLMVELFDEEFPQFGGGFCARIDNYEPRAEQLINDFKSTDGTKELTIAVSVDMLDTGIDIPSLVNLVFAKPVKSYAKFWQMIGRGTRLCPDLFGPDKDKEYFQIFDHWGNFEYFDELTKEEEPSQAKTLMEQLFEARIAQGEAALAAQSSTALKLTTQQLAADISSLPSDCLSVREKRREIESIKEEGILDGFHASTIAALRSQISPLMQWRSVRKKEAALKFDLLIAQLQEAKLTKSSKADDLRDSIINQILELPINLKQVAEKQASIDKGKAHTFYETADVEDIENLRTELRGIMQYRKRGSAPPREEPVYLNMLRDDGVQSVVHTPKLEGLDLVAYRNRVESVLSGLIEENPALQKIRQGKPVDPSDLDALAEAVILQAPDVKLKELLKHFPNNARNLALAIRQIVGMDSERVGEHFSEFLRRYPAISSTQIRFLDLLKSHIARYGSIEIDTLYEAPFTNIHIGGVDGVFSDEAQIDDLLNLITAINQPAA